MNAPQAGAPVPAVILLAAGAATRFGSPKQLATLAGEALVHRAARQACASGARVLVVTGAHADAVEAALQGLDLVLLRNPDWEAGMGSSIACAMRHLLAAAPPAAVIVALADQALVGAAQFRRLIDAHRADPERIVAAERGDGIGPPSLFPPEHFAALAALQGPQGARALLQAHSDRLLRLPMPEAALDIDTPADYERAQRLALRP